MLEKPDLKEAKIGACLQHEYGLPVMQVTFLPLGADFNTAVYRVVAQDRTPYFFKLRKGIFDATSVTLPRYLSEQGMEQIIPPLATQTGQLWGNLDAFKTILYPYIEGRNGYEVDLMEHHWRDFGTALRKLHTARLPPALVSRIRRETYCPQGRDTVKAFLARIEQDVLDDPIAIELATFLRSKRAQVKDLVERAEGLALALQAQPPEWVVCHSDIHAGNILIGANDALYIVDWDEPILAPKERDLMYIGGGLLSSGLTPQEEETLFYRTYGPTRANPVALAYYRYERIIQDIAVYCEQLFLTHEGGEDRERSLHYLKSNFLPDGTIEIAYQSDKTR
jgi:spectinomycin phosphotransferase